MLLFIKNNFNQHLTTPDLCLLNPDSLSSTDLNFVLDCDHLIDCELRLKCTSIRSAQVAEVCYILAL